MKAEKRWMTSLDSLWDSRARTLDSCWLSYQALSSGEEMVLGAVHALVDIIGLSNFVLARFSGATSVDLHLNLLSPATGHPNVLEFASALSDSRDPM